jgi:hypothetical protein
MSKAIAYLFASETNQPAAASASDQPIKPFTVPCRNVAGTIQF